MKSTAIERMRVWIERNTWEIPCPPAAVQSPCRSSTDLHGTNLFLRLLRDLFPLHDQISLQRNPFHNTHLLFNGARNDRSTVHVNRSHPPPTNPKSRRLDDQSLNHANNAIFQRFRRACYQERRGEAGSDRRTIERNEPTMRNSTWRTTRGGGGRGAGFTVEARHVRGGGRGVNVCTRRSARTGNLSRFIPPR